MSPLRPDDPKDFIAKLNDTERRLRAVERVLQIAQGSEAGSVLQTFEDGTPLGDTLGIDFGPGLLATLISDRFVKVEGAAGGGFCLGDRWESGSYHVIFPVSSGTGTNWIQSDLRLYPMAVCTAVTYDRLVFEITSTGSGTRTARIGLYDDDVAYPGALLYDSGDISTDAGAGFYEHSATNTLNPGLYWLGLVLESTGIIQSARSVVNDSGILAGRSSSPLGANSPRCYQQSLVTGALPDPFAGSLSANAPAYMQIRVA